MKVEMKKLAILLMSALMLTGCNAQDKDAKAKDNSIKPKIDYKVNKKYDDNGNLIGYDSTYTYYYSNIDKDAMIKDSIFQKFNEHFSNLSMFEDDKFFDEFFKQNTYSEDEFFKDDFFRESFKNNQKIMEEMMKSMDEMKNQFFMQQYPLKEKKQEEDN